MSVGCCQWHGRFELVVAALRDIVFLLATSLMHVCVTFLGAIVAVDIPEVRHPCPHSTFE